MLSDKYWPMIILPRTVLSIPMAELRLLYFFGGLLGRISTRLGRE